jgi:hypothetical protein
MIVKWKVQVATKIDALACATPAPVLGIGIEEGSPRLLRGRVLQGRRKTGISAGYKLEWVTFLWEYPIGRGVHRNFDILMDFGAWEDPVMCAGRKSTQPHQADRPSARNKPYQTLPESFPRLSWISGLSLFHG